VVVRIVLALLMVLLMVVVIGLYASADQLASDQMRVTLSVGLLMVGGWLMGMLCEKVRLPAITGYLLFGLLVSPSLWDLMVQLFGGDGGASALVPESQITPKPGQKQFPLRFAGDLAIALIALTAGGEIYFRSLRGRVGKVLVILAAHMLVLILGVFVFVMAAKPWIPFLADESWMVAGIVALITSVVMVAKSPAVTIAMISDYRAAGPLSETTLLITVIKDLILIVLFACVMAVSKSMLKDDSQLSGGFLLKVGLQLLGSVGVGVLFGLVMAAYIKNVMAHLAIFVVGCCLLIALIGEYEFLVAGQHVHLEPLLMALSAGILIRNVWTHHSEKLFHTIETMSLPVYCLFFALAGTRINLSVFASVWILSATMVAVRLVLTWFGIKLGLKLTGTKDDWGKFLWMGMVSQAGVSLVLVTLIADNQGFGQFAWAQDLKSALIGAIFINQLVGPIAFRHGLMASGEAGQAGLDDEPNVKHV
jgi:Kef-type K+ transport system membrane component KefB